MDNHTNKIVATMKVGGKDMKMLIDSGASCNVLPFKYLPKGTMVEKSSHTLKMYSKSTMSAIGKAKISLVNPKNMESYLIDFTIVDGNIFCSITRSGNCSEDEATGCANTEHFVD